MAAMVLGWQGGGHTKVKLLEALENLIQQTAYHAEDTVSDTGYWTHH